MVNVGIVGGTGYTGVELLRLLTQHPKVKIKAITLRSEAGMSVAELFTNLRGHIDLKFSDPADAKLNKCDLVFFATQMVSQCSKPNPCLKLVLRSSI